MRLGGAWALALAFGIAGCSGPSPSRASTPIATSPGPSAVVEAPSPSPTPGANLTITGSGAIPCPIPGCRASVELVRGAAPTGSLPPGFEPVGGWAFELTRSSVRGQENVGRIIDAPASIADGTYRVVAAASIVSDVSSGAPDASGHYPLSLLGWDLCEAALTVVPGLRHVRIDVRFRAAGGCTVATAAGVS